MFEIKKAYITFKSTETAKAVLDKFGDEDNAGCCSKRAVIEDEDGVEFKYEVSEAHEPDMIQWKNLGVSKTSRNIRRGVSLVVCIILLVVSVVGQVYLK
jgi:hypothetical protein